VNADKLSPAQFICAHLFCFFFIILKHSQKTRITENTQPG